MLLTDNQIKLQSDNAKVKEELKSIKISFELDKQQKMRGDIVLCGLPADRDLNPKKVIEKLCVKLNIDPEKIRSVSDHQVQNKSAREKNLLVESQ